VAGNAAARKIASVRGLTNGPPPLGPVWKLLPFYAAALLNPSVSVRTLSERRQLNDRLILKPGIGATLRTLQRREVGDDCQAPGRPLNRFQPAASERILGRKLQDAGIRGALQYPEGGGTNTVRWVGEIRVVQQVEELEPQFGTVAFGNLKSACQVRVQAKETRPEQRIVTCVPVSTGSVGRKCRGCDPDSARHVLYIGVPHDIRTVLPDAGQGVIRAGHRTVRKSGVNAQQKRRPPVPQNRIDAPVRELRNVVHERVRPTVTQVRIANPVVVVSVRWVLVGVAAGAHAIVDGFGVLDAMRVRVNGE